MNADYIILVVQMLGVNGKFQAKLAVNAPHAGQTLRNLRGRGLVKSCSAGRSGDSLGSCFR